MVSFSPTHSAYLFTLALYITSWLILLSGISAVQHTCTEDLPFFARFQASSFLANQVGKHCNKLFRFPWFVVWLCFLPLFLEAIALLGMSKSRSGSSRGVTAGTGAPLYAVIATLCILLANTFYNMTETGGLANMLGLPSGLTGTMKARFRCTLSGFALVATFALLLLFIAPFCDRDDNHEAAAQPAGKPRPAAAPTGGQAPSAATPAQVIV